MENANEDTINQTNGDQKNISKINENVVKRLLGWKIMYGGGFGISFLSMCNESALNVVRNAYWFRCVAIAVVCGLVLCSLYFKLVNCGNIGNRFRAVIREFSRFRLCVVCVVAGGVAALCVSSMRLYIEKGTTDYLYCENVIDNYGMFKAVGKQSKTPIPGWYRFTYKGTHSTADNHIHRYDSNQKQYGFLPWRYRTLHSVELVDGAGHTLSLTLDAEMPPTRIVYKYRQDGLDVETWEYSRLDSMCSEGFHLECVDKWYDSGDNINVECRMFDGGNGRIFAPSSLMPPWDVMPPFDVVLPHSKFSSYKVVRDEKGRGKSILAAIPDHDGIKRIDFEYADNDEHDLPYVKHVMYINANVGGIRQIEIEYNGTSINIRETGNLRRDIKIDSISRNEYMWTNIVDSCYVNNGNMNTNLVRSQTRTLDNEGRVVKEMKFLRSERGEELLAEDRYCWTVVNEVNVVSDIEHRDGEGNLVEKPFLMLSDVFGSSSANMPMAARIRYIHEKGFFDALLFDATGTNVTDRIRFCGEKNGRERIEWRSHDGGKVVPIGIWKDSVAVAWELADCQDDVGVAKPNAANRLQCRDIRWLDERGKLAQCPAGWAVRRIFTNPDYNDDVEDVGFSGQVRRIEYLGTDGNPCKVPGLVPIQEYDHDKSGRIVEIRSQDANGRPMTFIVPPNGVIAAFEKIIYDGIGRVTRRQFFDENGKPCEQSELVYTYNGMSRIPAKVEMVARDGSRIDETKNGSVFCGGVNPWLMLPVGMSPTGRKTEEPD